MKLDVAINVFPVALARTGHSLVGGLYGGDLLGCGAPSCQLGRRRLENLSDLAEIENEPEVQPGLTNPSEYIGIGEVPVAPWSPRIPAF